MVEVLYYDTPFCGILQLFSAAASNILSAGGFFQKIRQEFCHQGHIGRREHQRGRPGRRPLFRPGTARPSSTPRAHRQIFSTAISRQSQARKYRFAASVNFFMSGRLLRFKIRSPCREYILIIPHFQGKGKQSPPPPEKAAVFENGGFLLRRTAGCPPRRRRRCTPPDGA